MRRVFNSLRILRMTQAAASVLILLLVTIFVLPSYSGAVDPSSLSVVQTNDSAEAGGKNIICTLAANKRCRKSFLFTEL